MYLPAPNGRVDAWLSGPLFVSHLVYGVPRVLQATFNVCQFI